MATNDELETRIDTLEETVTLLSAQLVRTESLADITRIYDATLSDLTDRVADLETAINTVYQRLTTLIQSIV